MDAPSQDFASVDFSTRGLAPARRLPALRELFDRSVCLAIDTEPDPIVEMSMHVMPGLRRAKMLSPLTARMSRPAPMLADGEDTVCLMIKTGGRMSLSQRRQEGAPGLGEGVLLVYREPAIIDFAETTYTAVRVPFAALSRHAGAIEDAAARRIPRDAEALGLLLAYLSHLPAHLADPALGRLSTSHIYDLMALALGSAAEGGALARQGGLRAARLAAVRRELSHDPALGIGEIAHRQGVSPRYIQMLFEEDGTTFSQFALERRLQAARAMLESPRFARLSIATIAMDAGFGDLSHFNHCFKRRFAMTPRELRLAANAAEGPPPAIR